jgi:hypothetical protein
LVLFVKLFVSTGWSQYVRAYQYFSITSLYPVQENVLLEEVIVAHSDGEVIVSVAGITTLKFFSFDVMVFQSESIIAIVNLYFQVCKFDNVILH